MSKELNENFRERDEEIAGSLLAMLSGEHVLFIGPPGTAKSMLARELCKSIKEGNFFYYLLTRFTTPDEIFGPLSLSSLQEDIFRRNIEGYLPTAHVSFLDEIFKANSSILNSLLTILNERKYHNGCEILDVPLISVFGASNELPEENESLEALYDRFLFRFYIGYVQDETNFVDIILGHSENFTPSVQLTVEEIRKELQESADVTIDNDVMDSIVALRKEFRTSSISISDRRWKKMVGVLKVAAHSLGRSNVDKSMLPILKHMLWNRPEEKVTIGKRLVEMAVAGGLNLDKEQQYLQDLHDSAKQLKDFELPEIVTCKSCGQRFSNWKGLQVHASAFHDHAYMLPDDDNLYQLWKHKVSPHLLPNLIELYASRGHPVILTASPQDKELYIKELNDFQEDLGILEKDLGKEREVLVNILNNNIWLTPRDREGIMAQYDIKTKAMVKMKKLHSETREIVLSEDVVEP